MLVMRPIESHAKAYGLVYIVTAPSLQARLSIAIFSPMMCVYSYARITRTISNADCMANALARDFWFARVVKRRRHSDLSRYLLHGYAASLRASATACLPRQMANARARFRHNPARCAPFSIGRDRLKADSYCSRTLVRHQFHLTRVRE